MLTVTIQRCQQPGIGDQLLHLTAQLRFTENAARQCMEVVKQPLPDGIHIPLVSAGEDHEIALALLKQLQQPMFNSDMTVPARLTK
ncbi:hypothetical protein D3C78_423490 [compost metagenome]